MQPRKKNDIKRSRSKADPRNPEQADTVSRDSSGRFLTGNYGGPGRPLGSRNRLSENFLTDVCADWEQHCISVIADVRNKYPAVYFRIVASIVPRDQPGPVQTTDLDDLTDAELIASMKAEAAEFERLYPGICEVKPPRPPR
jgi:hypothetical protein